MLSEFTVGPDGEINFLSPVAQVPREEFELGQPTMRGIRSRAIHITCFLSPFSILNDTYEIVDNPICVPLSLQQPLPAACANLSSLRRRDPIPPTFSKKFPNDHEARGMVYR